VLMLRGMTGSLGAPDGPPGPRAAADGADQDVDATVRYFLIADVRGYTRFTQAHGDEAGGALASRFAAVTRRL